MTGGQSDSSSKVADASGGPARNHPPSVVRVGIRLENENNLDIVRVLPVVADEDGDAVTLGYEWTKNGEAAGNGETLSGFKRGDKVSVLITPYDGKEYGQPKTFNTEIQNTCPQVTGQTDFVFDGTVLTTSIKAVDPDGDRISYSLVNPPAGVTIEEESGRLQWIVPPGFVGRQEVKVKISDGAGGELVYTLPIEVAKLVDKTGM